MTFFKKIVKTDPQDDGQVNVIEEQILEEEEMVNESPEVEPSVDLVDQFFDQVAEAKSEESRDTYPETSMLDQENPEGQLSVDVFQTKDSIVVKSTIAGVRPEDLDVAIDNDMVTIRGSRYLDTEVVDDDYFYQECYWGAFSRSIILPMEVDTESSEAVLKNGVLTITFPKNKQDKSVNIKIKEG